MRFSKRLFVIALSLCLFCVLVSGCGPAEQAEGKNGVPSEITITDSTGQEIVLTEKLGKVVVLNPPAAEVLRILQIPESSIVGVAESIQNSPFLGFDSIESIGTSSTPNIEKIVELKPDAVISQGKWLTGSDEFREKLEPLGIKIIALDVHQIDKYDQCMKALAKAFGKEKRADEFLEWKAEQEKKISDKVKNLAAEEKKKVIQLYGNKLPKNEWQTSSKGEQAGGTGPDQQINMAGGINLARDLEQDYPTINVEWIVEQNPDVILITSYDLGYAAEEDGGAAELVNLVLANKGVAATAAGKGEQVYVTASLASTPYLSAQFVAKWLYPDLFADIDPEDALKDYFDQWLGVPFKGSWVYPPLSK
ncbi:MAG: ABC transporter substrate-binding protein [Firmicutes bacterium]|nr:ABC transporter substrate-binding protein [Bacillota bacterium]